MIHHLLAGLVVALHLVFIVYVVIGGLLALRWRWAPWIHVPAVAWAIYVEISGRVCPLTPLENSLREAAGAAGYAGGFVEHYLVPILYPPGLSPSLQLLLAAFVFFANVLVYAIVWRRRAPIDV